MKKLLLILIIIFAFAIQGEAFPPTGDCTDNCSFTGTTTLGGTDERIESLTDSNIWIDFNDTTNLLTIGSGIYGAFSFPGDGHNERALELIITKSDDANNSPVVSHLTFTNNDTDLVFSYISFFQYDFNNIDMAAGASTNARYGLYVLMDIDGAAGDTIGTVVAATYDLKWSEGDADDDMTITTGIGQSLSLRAGADNLGDGNVLTFGTLDMMRTDDAGSGGTIAVTGILSGIHLKDVDGNGGTIADQTGILIDDLTTGTVKHGIVLADGTDGIYLNGIATPTLLLNDDGTNGAITVNAGLDVVGIPTGTTANGALGGGEAVVGAVCQSNSNEIYIDTNGSCAD